MPWRADPDVTEPKGSSPLHQKHIIGAYFESVQMRSDLSFSIFVLSVLCLTKWHLSMRFTNIFFNFLFPYAYYMSNRLSSPWFNSSYNTRRRVQTTNPIKRTEIARYDLMQLERKCCVYPVALWCCRMVDGASILSEYKNTIYTSLKYRFKELIFSEMEQVRNYK